MEKINTGISYWAEDDRCGWQLDAKTNQKVPSIWRKANGCYDLDTQYEVLVFSFPDMFTERQVDNAHDFLWRKDWMAYKGITGITVG